MGSGTSTHVKTIHPDNTMYFHAVKRKENTQHTEQSLETEEGPATLTEKSTHVMPDYAVQKIADLEKRLAESDSENLDLQDRIHSLEERLAEEVGAGQTVTAGTCRETLQAKDQYISKVDAELTAARLEVTKMKVRHKKKVRSMTCQMAEVKQGASIQLFELRDEISRLNDEQQHLKTPSNVTGSTSDSTSSLPSNIGGHMSLILDLSQQVSEQQEKIRKLEQTLGEKNKQIKELKTSEPSSVIHQTSPILDSVLGSTLWEDNSTEDMNSDFKATGWHCVTGDSKQKSKYRSSALTPVEEAAEHDRKDGNMRSDSGIGSAGKLKGDKDRLRSLNTGKRIGSGSSGLSELTMSESDSDWGSDYQITPPNKVQSAPPGLRSPHQLPRGDSGEDNWSGGSQNGAHNSRLKKKKSHLRSKALQKKNQSEYPVHKPELLGPTLAFVEQT